MKRFLYYNQDSVNSFLAQIEQGLQVSESAENEESNSHSFAESSREEISGDLSAKVLGIGTALKGTLHSDDADTEVATNLIRNVQEKVLHDYAFDRVYRHVVKNGLVNNEDPKIGDIILVTETPTFLDFNYFQSLFADNGAVKMVNDQNQKKLKELKESMPKGTAVPPLIKKQMDNLRTTINNAEPERKEMLKTIEAIRNTLPYNRFIMTSNMLMPLDDENFRDNPDIVAFKYGGNISMFGYVTNIVSADETPVRNNDFAPLYDTINQIMLQMFNEQSKIYIVHPVALFY